MKKVLLVRIGRLGDMVMITPVVKALLDSDPDVEIHLLTGPEGRLVFRQFDPRLTQVIQFPKGLANGFKRQALKRYLKKQQYDQVFCFEGKARYHKFLQGVGEKLVLLPPHDKSTHFSQFCWNVVSQNVSNKLPASYSYLPVDTDAQHSAQQLLNQHGVADTDLVVMMHPSYSGYRPGHESRDDPHRLWPVENFAALADKLSDYAQSQQQSLKIVMDLLPQEKSLGEQIVKQSKAPIVLLCETPNFNRYKALIKRANLFVASNTGPMHVAAALDTPTIALFSLISPEDCGPYMAPDKCCALRAEDYSSSVGIRAITPDAVFNAACDLLPA